MTTKCIFISHSAKEPETANFLELLYDELTKESFDVLVDRERLKFADNWKYEIFNWMGSCHCALILFSKNSIKNSIWAEREVNILKWRQTQDSNFFLIPIYFGVTLEDVKKNELFADLNLHEIVGPIDGDIEVFVQKLKELIKELDITTPLDKVALKIKKRLEHLSSIEKTKIIIINTILGELNIEITPWSLNRDPCLALARKMLNLGLYESASILDKLCDYLESKDVRFIFDLLAPSWVDIHAATCVSRCALHEGHKTAVVLNSNQFISADMYVRRASNRPPKCWLIRRISCVYGIDPVADLVTEIETVLIEELKLDEYKRNEDDTRLALKRALIMRNKNDKPVFISLNYSKNIAEFLPELQKTFPHVTFFLLTGEDFPELNELEGLRFKFLEPRLEPKAENQALDDYCDAHAMIP